MTLRLGISACLLGDEVRWNGGHKRDNYLTDVLGPNVEWTPICPEVEIGLGVPRPTIRLEGPRGAARLIQPGGPDLTDSMESWSNAFVRDLDVDGFIFKKGSPSCGPDRVRQYDGDKMHTDGTGVFAGRLIAAQPRLAIIDEGRLRDPNLREDFLDHAVWHRRWRERNPSTPDEVMTFHRDHKLSYMAHHPDASKRLGPLASSAAPTYADEAAKLMQIPTTRGRHTNVMQHLAGFVTSMLDAGDRKELVDAIDGHAVGTWPRLVPLTLLRHHIRREDVPSWLHAQTYLDPYPKEWVIRHRT